MICLCAKKSNDRGKAFENYVAILFSKLGYNIDNVNIRRAGRELDIATSSKITSEKMLIECKGRIEKTSGPDLNKFYGAYDHEYRQKKVSVGLLVSLSGFNSEAKDYYDEKNAKVKKRFRIVDPKELLQLSVEAKLTVNDETIRNITRKVWPFDLGDTHLVISKTALYRVQILEKDDRQTHFIAYRAMGEDVTDYEIEMLKHDVKLLRNMEAYNVHARKQLLMVLSSYKNAVKLDTLCTKTNQSSATVQHELDYLLSRKCVTSTGGRYKLARDLIAFAEISKELLATDERFIFLQSPYFREMNDSSLVEYTLQRRRLERLDRDGIKCLNEIFSISPNALERALFGDISIYETDNEQATGKDSKHIKEIMLSIYLKELAPPLLGDMHDAKNLPLRERDGVVGVVGAYEHYDISLADSQRVIFRFGAGGFMALLRAEGDIKAGQIVSAKIPTHINTSLTRFNLQQTEDSIDEMIKLFNSILEKPELKNEKAILANNIAGSYLTLGKHEKAKEWIQRAKTFDVELKEIQSNETKIDAALKTPKTKKSKTT